MSHDDRTPLLSRSFVQRPTLAAVEPERPLRIATLNVFVGSPLPFLDGATTSLAGSERLSAQIAGLHRRNLDVLCLQELMCPATLRSFQRTFTRQEFECITAPRDASMKRGTAIAWIAIILMSYLIIMAANEVALVASGVGGGSPAANAQDQTPQPSRMAMFYMLISHTTVFFLATIAVLSVVCCVYYVVHESALYVWLTGIQTGLVVFVRRHQRITVTQINHTLFSEQHGDALNFFNPRGFTTVRLTVDGRELMLVNTHLNHGDAECRHRHVHIRQLVSTLQCAPQRCILVGDLNVGTAAPEFARLVQGAELRNSLTETNHDTLDTHTWLQINPLTSNPFLAAVQNTQLDYILIPKCTSVVRLQTSHRIFDRAPFVSDHAGIVADIVLVANATSSPVAAADAAEANHQ
jgi:endonuclease/exonuclease/phosphatase family metal-dependent hydrolase